MTFARNLAPELWPGALIYLQGLRLTPREPAVTKVHAQMMIDLVAWIIRVVSGIRLLPEGAFAPTPTIYFANHSSHLDFATIWAALPPAVRQRARPVAGRDYWEKTAFRKRLAGSFFKAVLIERQHVTVSCSPMEPMLAALDAGDSLIVFPEGTRSPDGRIHDFKSGLFHLARARPAIPLVPVYLQNLSRILPKGDFLPVPLIANLSVGGKISLNPDETKPAFLHRARSAIEQLAR